MKFLLKLLAPEERTIEADSIEEADVKAKAIRIESENKDGTASIVLLTLTQLVDDDG